MLKRLLIPGLAIGALTLLANPVKAGTFVIDDFNRTSNGLIQRTVVGSNQAPPRSSIQNNLTGVFGGSRRIRIDSLTNPFNQLNAASISVDPNEGALGISNNLGVTSNALTRYDGNGQGLHTLTRNGSSLGDWTQGSNNEFDYFAIKVKTINTQLLMTFSLEDKNGNKLQVSRNIINNGGQIMINNNPVASATDLAIFRYEDFINYGISNGINFDFGFVRAAQVDFKGLNNQTNVNAKIEYIRGVEIPEPSLGIGTIIILGVGLASVKGNKNYSPDNNSFD